MGGWGRQQAQLRGFRQSCCNYRRAVLIGNSDNYGARVCRLQEFAEKCSDKRNLRMRAYRADFVPML